MLTPSQLDWPNPGDTWKVVTLQDTLELERCIIPKGTTIYLKASNGVRLILLPTFCKDQLGFEIPRRVFKE